MEKIQVTKISQHQAEKAMRDAGLTDPAKRATPVSIAAAGECFSLQVGDSSGVFVIEKTDSKLWISGAGAVKSKGLTGSGLAIIEEIAKQSGLSAVGFQTGRPGLVKLAKQLNYKIVGFIMEKVVA